jgi:anti-anti-sigma factor
VLTVTPQKQGNALILRCRGRIVRGEETAILCSASRANNGTVVLDLTEVETIDAAGIGALVSLQAAGIYLTIINPSEQVREILRLTRLDSIFEIATASLTGEREDRGTSAPDHACHATAG